MCSRLSHRPPSSRLLRANDVEKRQVGGTWFQSNRLVLVDAVQRNAQDEGLPSAQEDATAVLAVRHHPTHRLLTNELYRRAGRLLEEGFEGVGELRQGRDEVKCPRVAHGA